MGNSLGVDWRSAMKNPPLCTIQTCAVPPLAGNGFFLLRQTQVKLGEVIGLADPEDRDENVNHAENQVRPFADGWRHPLATSISGIAPGAQQQRHMIVLAGITNLEGDAHLRIERLHTLRAKVSGNIKKQPVGAALEWPCGRNQIAGAPALVRGGRPQAASNHFPRAFPKRRKCLRRDARAQCREREWICRSTLLQSPFCYASAARLARAPACASSFSRRRRMMRLCSSAAIVNSAEASF